MIVGQNAVTPVLGSHAPTSQIDDGSMVKSRPIPPFVWMSMRPGSMTSPVASNTADESTIPFRMRSLIVRSSGSCDASMAPRIVTVIVERPFPSRSRNRWKRRRVRCTYP